MGRATIVDEECPTFVDLPDVGEACCDVRYSTRHDAIDIRDLLCSAYSTDPSSSTVRRAFTAVHKYIKDNKSFKRMVYKVRWQGARSPRTSLLLSMGMTVRVLRAIARPGGQRDMALNIYAAYIEVTMEQNRTDQNRLTSE